MPAREEHTCLELKTHVTWCTRWDINPSGTGWCSDFTAMQPSHGQTYRPSTRKAGQRGKRKDCRREINSRLVMYSSGGMAFLPLLSLAFEGGVSMLRPRGSTENKITSLLEMCPRRSAAPFLGSCGGVRFLSAAAPAGAEEGKRVSQTTPPWKPWKLLATRRREAMETRSGRRRENPPI